MAQILNYKLNNILPRCLQDLYLYKTMMIMLFSKGQKIFALAFIISFIIMLILAYRSDAKIHKTYYKNVWVVLISMILILAALTVLIKFMH